MEDRKESAHQERSRDVGGLKKLDMCYIHVIEQYNLTGASLSTHHPHERTWIAEPVVELSSLLPFHYNAKSKQINQLQFINQKVETEGKTMDGRVGIRKK